MTPIPRHTILRARFNLISPTSLINVGKAVYRRCDPVAALFAFAARKLCTVSQQLSLQE